VREPQQLREEVGRLKRPFLSFRTPMSRRDVEIDEKTSQVNGCCALPLHWYVYRDMLVCGPAGMDFERKTGTPLS
jgi:hypothetical protein